MKTRAAILATRGEPLIVDEIEIPDPGPDQVLVRMRAAGICHSDLHTIKGGRAALPLVPGHEGAGVVAKVGAGVTHVKEGDPVIVTWMPRQPGSRTPAFSVYNWRGRDFQARASTWAEHTLVPGLAAVKMEDEVSSDLASVIGCAAMTGCGAVLNTVKVQAGESVAVFGCGGVGLCIIQAAANVGAKPVIAVDLLDEKLEFASSFGATHLVNGAKGDAVAEVQKISGGGVDYAFDAIGKPETAVQIVEAVRLGLPGLRPGGTAVLVGLVQEPFSYTMQMFFGEQRLTASHGGSPNPDVDFPRYIEWYREGKLDLERLVTMRYPLSEVNEGVEELRSGRVFGRSVLVMAP